MIRQVAFDKLVAELEAQKIRKRDLVVPASHLKLVEGQLNVLEIGREKLTAGLAGLGVTVSGEDTDDRLQLDGTTTFWNHVADKLKIPVVYLRRLLEEAVPLLDQNVNWWLERAERNYLVRAFTPVDGEGPGLARALLSDRFKIVDHLDLLTTALDAIRSMGRDVRIDSCDLTETRMYVKMWAPEICTPLGELLSRYKSRRGGHEWVEGPDDGMFSGLVLGNSEVGAGQWFIKPRMIVKACWNGAVIEADGLAKVHLGSQLSRGEIEWSEKTQEQMGKVILMQVQDAVRTFLDPAYARGVVDRWQGLGQKMIEYPVDAVSNVTKAFGYSDETKESILRSFMDAGDRSAFGLAQAVTWTAAEMETGDQQYEMELAVDRILVRAPEFDRPSRN